LKKRKGFEVFRLQ